jgi:hypothetical protein
MLQPTDELTVRMTAAEWNQVLAVLSEGAYRIVAPLIIKIRDQGMAQHDHLQQANSEDAARVPN